MTITDVSIVCGLASAALWLASAIVTPTVTASYWGGPPEHIVSKLKIGSLLNAAGALFAALSIGLQAYATYLAT